MTRYTKRGHYEDLHFTVYTDWYSCTCPRIASRNGADMIRGIYGAGWRAGMVQQPIAIYQTMEKGTLVWRKYLMTGAEQCPYRNVILRFIWLLGYDAGLHESLRRWLEKRRIAQLH